MSVHCSVEPPLNFLQMRSGRERSKLWRQSFWLVMLADLGMNCNWMMMLQGFIGFQDCIRECNIRFENVFNFVSTRLKIIPRGTKGNCIFEYTFSFSFGGNAHKRLRKLFMEYYGICVLKMKRYNSERTCHWLWIFFFKLPR